MSITTTPNLGLEKPAYNTEKDTWGGNLNDNADKIDAFAGKVVTLLSSGVNQSATFTLALPSTYAAFILRLYDARSPVGQAYLKVSVDGGSNYLAGTSYEYARTDVSSQSGGTQTLAGSAGEEAFLLSAEMANQGSDTAYSGVFDIEISTHALTTTFATNVKATGAYRNSGGHRTVSSFAGALVSPAAKATNIKLGSSGSSYGNALLCRYALFGVVGI